jgi:hypothetical protein
MLVNMIIVHVMQMAIMQIVDMPLMTYCRMPTIGTVPVRMIRMMILIASGHVTFLSSQRGRRLLRFGSTLDAAFRQTKDVSVGKRIVDVLCFASSFNQSHVVQHLKTSRTVVSFSPSSSAKASSLASLASNRSRAEVVSLLFRQSLRPAVSVRGRRNGRRGDDATVHPRGNRHDRRAVRFRAHTKGHEYRWNDGMS